MVTGCLGFIGSHLVDKLKSLDYEVLEVDENFNIQKPGVDYWNVEWKGFVERYVDKGLDYIFHFGSPCSILQFQENLEYCVQNSIRGFQNVLKLAEYSQAKLIFPSSGNIYGGCLVPPYHEDMSPAPVNIYGVCKFLCETMSRSNTKVDSVGLRIFTGYGKGEEKKGKLASVVYHFLSDINAGKSPVIWGDGEQRRDCIFVDDIVDVAVKCMTVKTPPVVNIATGKDLSYNEIVEKINKVLGTDIKPTYVKKPANYVDNAVADVSLMRKTFGLQPMSLEEGLRKWISQTD